MPITPSVTSKSISDSVEKIDACLKEAKLKSDTLHNFAVTKPRALAEYARSEFGIFPYFYQNGRIQGYTDSADLFIFPTPHTDPDLKQFIDNLAQRNAQKCVAKLR